jgi:hypothetical protein
MTSLAHIYDRDDVPHQTPREGGCAHESRSTVPLELIALRQEIFTALSMSQHLGTLNWVAMKPWLVAIDDDLQVQCTIRRRWKK